VIRGVGEHEFDPLGEPGCGRKNQCGEPRLAEIADAAGADDIGEAIAWGAVGRRCRATEAFYFVLVIATAEQDACFALQLGDKIFTPPGFSRLFCVGTEKVGGSVFWRIRGPGGDLRAGVFQ